jgi:hypothetical protein
LYANAKRKTIRLSTNFTTFANNLLPIFLVSGSAVLGKFLTVICARWGAWSLCFSPLLVFDLMIKAN